MSLSNIEFMTWNVNYSRRAMNEYAKYSWENRRNDVYKVIQSANPAIIFLQEVLSENQQEVQVNLSQYQWHFESTNSRDGVCCNAIGIAKSFLPGAKQEKFSYNFNQFEKTAEKVLGLTIGELCLINVHCPMEVKGRFAMAESMSKCFPTDKTCRVIIAGDFNSFPDGKGPEQLEAMRKVTETIAISDLAISEVSKKVATHSFKPYPYDIVPKEALTMSGKLDHIFVKGFNIANDTVPLVMDAQSVKGEDFSPSDHYPIKVTLTIV